MSLSKISSYFALPNSCSAPGHGRSSEIRNQTHSKRVSPANSCGKLLSWVTKTDENYYHHTGCWIMVICDYVSVSLPPHLASDTVNLMLGRKYEGRITYITFRQQILVGNYSPKWRKLTKTSVATLSVILWWFAVVSLSAGLCIQCHIQSIWCWTSNKKVGSLI